MGCSVSRPDTIFTTKNTITSSPTATKKPPVPRTLSLPAPLVHHPALKKGDTHHIVSLTSTTYGSLRLIDLDATVSATTTTTTSAAAVAVAVDNNNNNKTLTLTDLKDSSPYSVINAWELMAGLDDFDYSAKPFAVPFDGSFTFNSTNEDPKKSYLSPYSDHNGSARKFHNLTSALENSTNGKVNNLSDSFESAAGMENCPSTKPLWKHLSEESLLADMDPNVISSFRRALSSKQLGFNQSRTTRPVVSSARVSPLFDNGIQLPGTEDRIVLYFTSLRGIRRTYEDCCTVRMIFKGFRVPVDERDISMDSAYRKELQSVLAQKTVSLPHVFIRGKYAGGADEIKQLHEVGELSKLLEGFPVRDPGFVCESCGDVRFVPCSNCNGSHKVFDVEEEQLRRCQKCNENGLIRCPSCCC